MSITTPSIIDQLKPTINWNINFANPETWDADIISILMLVLGLILTFFGGKWFRWIIFFVAFIAGAVAGYFLIDDIFAIFKATLKEDTRLYISLGVGLFCGLLVVFIYKLAVFGLGIVCGVIFSQVVWKVIIAIEPNLPHKEIIQIANIVVFAIVFGLLSMFLFRILLKGITAFIGSFAVASSCSYFIQRLYGFSEKKAQSLLDWVTFFATENTYKDIGQTCNIYCIALAGAWIVLFAAGAFIQYKCHKKVKDPKSDDDDESSESSSSDHKRKKVKKHKRKKSDSLSSEIRHHGGRHDTVGSSSMFRTDRKARTSAIQMENQNDRNKYSGENYRYF